MGPGHPVVAMLVFALAAVVSFVAAQAPPVSEPRVLGVGEKAAAQGPGADVREWFAAHGLKSNTVKIDDFAGVPWLIAAYSVKAGDTILRVPAEHVLRGDKLTPCSFTDVFPALSNELYATALWLLDKQREHSVGDYFRVVQGLTPAIFWSDLSALEGSPIVDQIRGSRAEVGAIYSGIAGRFNTTTPILKHSLEDFERAVAFVLAHSVELVVGQVAQNRTQSGADGSEEQELVDVYSFFIAPGMDKPRHSAAPNAQIVLDEETGDVVLRATEAIPQGTEITVNRGNFSNSALLMRFGYVVDNNPNDDYPLQISISPKEENLALKQAILRSVSLPDGNLTVHLGRSKLSDGFLSLLRLHFATRSEIGGYQAALEGRILSMDNEWGVCRRILETVSALVAAYPRDLPADVERLGALDRGDVQLGPEEAMGLRYTVGERALLLSVARNVQLHWVDLLMGDAAQPGDAAGAAATEDQSSG